MKKLLLFILTSGMLFNYSCTIDEAEKSIDEFAGTFTGNLNSFTCEENATLIGSITDVTAVLTKDSETEITGKLSENGTELFVFNGMLDINNDNILIISEFIYNADTLFGKGEANDTELELLFASRSCPMPDDAFGITLQFK